MHYELCIMNHESLSAEIGGYLSPLFRFPLQHLIWRLVLLQPLFCSGNHFVGFAEAGRVGEGGFAFFILHPQHSVSAIGIDHRVAVAFLLEPSKGMHNGKKLRNIIGAGNGSEVKNGRHLLIGKHIHTLILHLPRIAATSSIHSDGVMVDWQGEQFIERKPLFCP